MILLKTGAKFMADTQDGRKTFIYVGTINKEGAQGFFYKIKRVDTKDESIVEMNWFIVRRYKFY